MLTGNEEKEILALLRTKLRCTRTQADLARELRVSPQYLADVLAGRRRIGAKLAKTLGFRRRVIFESVA